VSARRTGHASTTKTVAELPPPPASITEQQPHEGPALLYVTTTGEMKPVDREALDDRRERRLFRALAAQAGELADKADERDEQQPKHPVGFQDPTVGPRA
jgi:hypothetical protein